MNRRISSFSADSRGVTLSSRHGTKTVEAILHPRPYNSRARVIKRGCDRSQKLPLKERNVAPLHTKMARAFRRLYEHSGNPLVRTRAHKMWKHYSSTSRIYGK